MEDPISNLPEKEQGELLFINGDPDIEEPCMFERGMYSFYFYSLCYVKYINGYVGVKYFGVERSGPE